MMSLPPPAPPLSQGHFLKNQGVSKGRCRHHEVSATVSVTLCRKFLTARLSRRPGHPGLARRELARPLSHAYLVLSLSCWALISFSLGWPLCISCRAIWFTTATREAWLFISGSRLSNLQRQFNREVTCSVTSAARGGRAGVPAAPAYLCWMTSRSSSFSGICMLSSHCSFSSIQSSQAPASLNIL